ncbi:hypothetical protein FOZ60_005300 [Perkinsus olseni]|uniref:Uncharacterized protein n=3 Tax=Perkinsus olseni TaxID=32597 RepID=A0A7J6NRI2_PEROL|nr:hypothetical protein FOZ60_005300 [Perkinsus olseni]
MVDHKEQQDSGFSLFSQPHPLVPLATFLVGQDRLDEQDDVKASEEYARKNMPGHASSATQDADSLFGLPDFAGQLRDVTNLVAMATATEGCDTPLAVHRIGSCLVLDSSSGPVGARDRDGFVTLCPAEQCSPRASPVVPSPLTDSTPEELGLKATVKRTFLHFTDVDEEQGEEAYSALVGRTRSAPPRQGGPPGSDNKEEEESGNQKPLSVKPVMEGNPQIRDLLALEDRPVRDPRTMFQLAVPRLSAPPSRFGRTVQWTLGGYRILLGCDMVVFPTDRRGASPLDSLDSLSSMASLKLVPPGGTRVPKNLRRDAWVENNLLSVGKVAWCRGKRVSLCDTADLAEEEESGDGTFDPDQIIDQAERLLHFLKRHCTRQGGTYYLYRDTNACVLYDTTSKPFGDQLPDKGVSPSSSMLSRPLAELCVTLASRMPSAPAESRLDVLWKGLTLIHPQRADYPELYSVICMQLSSVADEMDSHVGLVRCCHLLMQALAAFHQGTSGSSYRQDTSRGGAPHLGVQLYVSFAFTAVRAVEEVMVRLYQNWCRLTAAGETANTHRSDERLRHSIAWQLWLMQWLAAAEVSLMKVDAQRRAVECWNVERDLCRVMAHRLHSMANCGISPQQISQMPSGVALEIVENDLEVLGEAPVQQGTGGEVCAELLSGTEALMDGTLEAAGLRKDWIKRTDDFRRSGRAQLASTINELGCIHLGQLTELLRSGTVDPDHDADAVVASAVDAFCESYNEFVSAGDKLNVMVPLVNLARLWLALANASKAGEDSVERYQCTYRAIRHLERAAKSASANREAESAFSKRDIYATAAEQAQQLGRHLATAFMNADNLTQEGGYSTPVRVAMEHDVIWQPIGDFLTKVKSQSIGTLASTMLSEALVFAGKAWTAKDANDEAANLLARCTALVDAGRAHVKLAEILKLASDTGKRSDAAITIISRRSEAAFQWLSKHVDEEPDAFVECVVVRAQLAQFLDGYVSMAECLADAEGVAGGNKRVTGALRAALANLSNTELRRCSKSSPTGGRSVASRKLVKALYLFSINGNGDRTLADEMRLLLEQEKGQSL